MEYSDILLAIVGILATIVIAFYMAFFKRSSKETAYVRTGFRGEHIILNSGALVLPILQEAIAINMNTHKIEIIREDDHALITKNRVRVNVKAEFHVRVKADRESISIAARTLGEKTRNVEHIKAQVQGFCIDSLRDVAATLELDDLHENRKAFSNNVMSSVTESLSKMGLELASVALTALDQTKLEHFPTDNALNIKGITYVKEQLAENERIQNEQEQNKIVAMAQKDYESAKKQNEIEKNQIENKLSRKQEIRFAELAQEKKVKERELETEREIERMKVEKDITVLDYEKEEGVKRATSQRAITESWMRTNEVEAEAIKTREQIDTAKDKEIAERGKIVELISAKKEADRHRIIATGTADAEKIEADAAKMRYEIEAAGKRALNEAANLLSNDQISLQVKQQIVNQLPSIIRESVKPIENIDGIKIVHVDGLTGNSSKGGGGEAGNVSVNGNLADQVVDSALRYKAQAPLVESLLKEVGLKGGDIKALTDNLKVDMEGNSSSDTSSDSSSEKCSSKEA